jgi:diphosphomevalonate decarboxylase
VQFEIYFEGIKTPAFAPKIAAFFKRVAHLVPWVYDYSFSIYTQNSFPHSSGIASSASGMSALALCLTDFHQELGSVLENPRQFASELARLGSGSAARSVYGGLVVWGKHNDLPASSDTFAVPYELPVHADFNSFQDVVLLVEKGQKETSSTAGHGLMHGHPFAERRFQQAHENMKRLMPILKTGDLEGFGEIVESEALTLHALMMTSQPNFILMKPNTLAILEHIRQFRKETKIPAYFTLDAGANVHYLFPEKDKQKVMTFVTEKLLAYCKNSEYICDFVGQGPKSL